MSAISRSRRECLALSSMMTLSCALEEGRCVADSGGEVDLAIGRDFRGLNKA